MLPRLALVPAVLLGAQAYAAARPADPWTLHRGLAEARVLEVWAPDTLWDAGLAEAARTLEAAGRWRIEREPRPDRPRMVFGSLEDPAIARLVDALAARHPAAVDARDESEDADAPGFAHGGERYRHPLDALVATFEDPDRPGLPLTLFAGLGPRALLGHAHDLTPVWRPGLTTYRRGELHRRVALAGRARSDAPLERGPLRAAYEARAGTASGTGFRARVLGGASTRAGEEVDLGGYAEAVSAARARVLEWLRAEDGERRAPPARLVVYRDARAWTDLRGPLAPYEVEGHLLRAHVLLEPPLPDDGGAAAAEVVATAVLGWPARPWLAAAAGVEASDAWWGRELGAWVAFLEAGGNALSVAELVDPAAPRRHSPHRVRPLRAFLFRHLRSVRGPAALRALWRGEVELAVDAALEASFRAALEENLREHAGALEAERAARRAAATEPRFRNGVVLRPGAHGFAGRGLAESLARAAELGADDVAVHVFAAPTPFDKVFASDPAPAVPAADLTDAEVLRVVLVARGLGLRSLLQPHHLTGDSGGLSGALHVGLPDAVRALFVRLEACLVHYALLAELAGCDVLSLGAGLGNLTRTGGTLGDALGDSDGRAVTRVEPPADSQEAREIAEQRAARSEGWRRLVERLRSTFGGALTYAAQQGGPGVGGEALQFALWPEFDLVGVDLFRAPVHPERPHVAPAARELEWRLENALEWVAEVGAAVDRPALVTSIGFPSSTEAWRWPWMPAGEVDLEAQARLYDALAAAVADARRARPDWSGFFLWTWSADPDAGGAQHRGFTPQRKPAEDALRSLLRH